MAATKSIATALLLVSVLAVQARSLSQAKTAAPPSYPSISAALKANAEPLKTLTAALEAAKLSIPADAKYTVFAPTNEAFSDANIKAKTGLTAAQLLEPKNKDILTKVLSYHIVPAAAVTSSQLKNGQVVDTSLPNSKLTVGLTGGKVLIKSAGSTATVVIPDIKAGNSVVHVVDKVLLPASLVKSSP